MDMSKLKKFVDFYEIYELVANGEETISGMRYCGKRHGTLISDEVSDGEDRLRKAALQKK